MGDHPLPSPGRVRTFLSSALGDPTPFDFACLIRDPIAVPPTDIEPLGNIFSISVLPIARACALRTVLLVNGIHRGHIEV